MAFNFLVSIFTLDLIRNALGSAEECYFLTCSSEQNPQNCLVVYNQSQVITLNPCGSNSICPVQNISPNLNHIDRFINKTCVHESSSICNYLDRSRLTGQDCCKHTDCQSEQCGKSGCIGIKESQHCSKDEECDTNLYCTDLGFCYKSYSSGSNGCKRDNECGAGYGCNFGKCVQYFSLSDGKKTEDSKFCKSMLKIGDICDSLSLYLQDEMSYYPFNCSIGDNCIFLGNSNKNPLFASTPCECDGKNKDTGYCGQYIRYLKCISSLISSALKYDSSNCSGKFSHTDDIDILFSCGSITEEQYNLVKNIYKETENWSLYQSQQINYCSKSLGLFDPDMNVLNKSINQCKKSTSLSLSTKTTVAITVTCVVIPSIIIGGIIFWLIKRRRNRHGHHIIPQSSRSQYQIQTSKAVESKSQKLDSILPSLIFSADLAIKGDPVCSICLNEIAYNDEIRVTLCSHPFHSNCLDEWLRQRNFSAQCPNCNENLL
ncbi:unnamed protein product [Blepharisma stoltei]|uniref:RING-type domain-containing protein n=1 Tax=Blepharisma stoltei TaxID=1481888 RepID=A0AAU9JC27_9CILI|nr:unnamed protein product [Blepharisma stoltei]